VIGINQTEETLEIRRIVNSLKPIATRGLLSMFESAANPTFAQSNKTAIRSAAGSPRSALSALMGLRQLERGGMHVSVHVERIFDALLSNTSWMSSIADVGLALWACAIIEPYRFNDFFRRWNLPACLAQFGDARRCDTVPLSWFLAGLASEGIACPETLLDTRDLAVETYNRLRQNQGEEGLFGRRSKNGSLRGRISGEIGTFDDQVFAIYSLTKYSVAYGDYRAMHSAMDCAVALCEKQGRLGQWWWRYNSSNGAIVDRFPVLSVHQYGTGPMALLALGAAAQCDFTPWICKGLQWIEENELGIQMRDERANAVWRAVDRTGLCKTWRAATNLFTGREDRESRFGLCPEFDCQPHELAWFLYAFGDWPDAYC